MATKLSRKPNDVFARIGAGSTRRVVDRIVKTWQQATPTDIEAGARWYGDDAQAHLHGLVAASNLPGMTVERAAVIIAHLSPRTSWSRNVAGAYALVTGGPGAAIELGCIRANVERALSSLSMEDPRSSFGPDAHKTRRFAANLLGDRKQVTVDVWAARVAFGDDIEDVEHALGLAGVYAATEHAYRLAALRIGVDPTTMQATTWVVARNGRAV